ncbi:vascular endothelial growth factor receptor precursor [Penaeus vannamei]|uniref:Vascular endothelial growth factor receptor n=1 Tax=Penaeus vannamei TaxID=6689 RepID=A0A3R7NDL5_PENVA|nr:vascular endothelial growth factor receptor precursor [Penaeus vannamei]
MATSSPSSASTHPSSCHQVDPQRDEIDLADLGQTPRSLPRDHPGPLSRSVSIRTGSAIAATSLATDISIGPRAVTPTTLRKQRTAHANGTAQVHNPTYRSVPTADGADEPDERERCQDSAGTVVTDLTASSSGQDYMKADSSQRARVGTRRARRASASLSIRVPLCVGRGRSLRACLTWRGGRSSTEILAARNLLLADENVVKISDFGLSRTCTGHLPEEKQCKGFCSQDLLPIKWMSVEAIRDCTFSVQSDIWAYGVTLWELFTLGSTPYPGVVVDVSFLDLIEGGYRMDKPKYATERIGTLACEHVSLGSVTQIQTWSWSYFKPQGEPPFSATLIWA